jgi:methanogenic corrinoid protein MtbC1
MMGDSVNTTYGALRDALDDALARKDRPAAVRVALDAVRGGRIDVPHLYTEVLGPLLTDTGAQWQRGEVRVWEEHFASATVRTIVESLYPLVLEAAEELQRTGHTVVLACPPREQHDLGLRMLADRFTLGGWIAHYLGTDTPVEEICVAASELDAGLIVLSASTHFNRVLLRGFVDAVAACAPNARVMVGGPAFALDRDWPAEELFDPAAFNLPPRAATEGEA